MKVSNFSFSLLLWLCSGNAALASTKSHVTRQLPENNIDTRIINGDDAEQGRYDYFTRLYGTSQCGGSLIASDLALTNAHCAGDLSVAAISQYDVADRTGVVFRTIEREEMHPDYGLDESIGFDRYDLMLVKFDTPVTKPFISLNLDEKIPDKSGDELAVLGFGFISPTGPVSQTLQVAETEYVDPKECTPLLCSGNCDRFPFPDDIICTKQNNPEIIRTCFGDSGGPVVMKGNTPDEDILVGVIQGSPALCGSDETVSPDINQNIYHSIDWIIQAGCELSDNPPEEWNCPEANEPTPSPTSMPSETPSTAPSETPSTVPSFNPTTFVPDDVSVFVEINFDSNPTETGWYIADKDLLNFRIGVPTGAYRPEWGFSAYSSVVSQVDLKEGEAYQFTIEDASGNGMCCDSTPGVDLCCTKSGSYQISLISGEILAGGDALFERNSTIYFTVPLAM